MPNVRFARYLLVLSLSVAAIVLVPQPANAGCIVDIKGPCLQELPTFCPPSIEPSVLSGGTLARWTVVLTCGGYIQRGDTVFTTWSWDVTVKESTGASYVYASDSGNRNLAYPNTNLFVVGAGTFHCEVIPGVWDIVTVSGYASNAYGVSRASEFTICN